MRRPIQGWSHGVMEAAKRRAPLFSPYVPLHTYRGSFQDAPVSERPEPDTVMIARQQKAERQTEEVTR